MGLITCPVCKNSASARAAACPKCGHPIAAPQAVSTIGLFSAFAAVTFILFVVGCGIAIATKPSETTLRNAVLEKYGMLYGAGIVAEQAGLLNFGYQDRLVYSTLSINIPTQPEQVIAHGYFGRVSVVSLAPLGNPRREQASIPNPVQPTVATSEPVYQAPAPSEPSFSPDAIRNGLRSVYPVMKAEMQAAANNTARQAHPASNFVGNGCVQKSLTTEAFQEIRWTYYGTYACEMKGAILGIAKFDFEVRVEGQVELRQGTMVRSIIGTSAQ